MATILINSEKYTLQTFDTEQEFEQAVILNQVHLFGINTVYIDVKKLMGKESTLAKGVPDGYLIDFFNTSHPQLYFVENELITHDIYSHITEQLARFATMAISSQLDIKNTLIRYIRSQSQIHDQIERKIKNTPFHNIDELMNFLVEQNDIKIVLVIDEETSDLNMALKIFHIPPDVVVLQRYANYKGCVYFYEPMRNELEMMDIKNASTQSIDFDTIVCAAFPEGFKHAYVDNDSWWAIRLSQEARERLKYIAIYEKWPIGEVKHYAEIDHIAPYKDSGKYIVYLKNKRSIVPIKLDVPYRRGVAPQGPRFTTLVKLKNAKKLSDLWK